MTDEFNKEDSKERPESEGIPEECIDRPTSAEKAEPITELALLPQDHPLMQKFQKLLKEHLLRAKAQVLEQLENIRHEIKAKEKLREEAGIKLYDIQESLKQQDIQIQEFEDELQQQLKLRDTEEQLIEKLEAEYKIKEAQAREMQSQYKRRMRELEQINELEGNTHNWVEELEDSVKTAKRTVHRDAQMQQQLNEEKHRSDILFFRLDTEVKKREKELNELKEELNDMTDCKEVLLQSLSNANADLTVLQSEHKRLSQAWGEVIVSISHRDKIMHELQVSIRKEEDMIKSHEFGINAAKKLIKRAKLEQEKLESFKKNMFSNFSLLKSECLKQEQTMNELEKKLQEMPTYLEATEKDFREAKKESIIIEGQLNRMFWRIDQLNKIKFELEEDILKTAQEQLIADKASKYRLKLLQTTQEQRRNMELNLSGAQKQLANALVQIEVWKGNLTRLNREHELQQNAFTALEKNCAKSADDLKILENQIDFKLKQMDKYNRELDELKKKGEDQFAGTQSERKIKNLEKLIQTAEQQIREHQQFWLMMQNHYVNLSQKRHDQLTEIQVTSKQLSILKQKALKIDSELEKAENEMRQLTREIQVSTTKVDLLNAQMFNKQQKHEQEEEECLQQHESLLQNLRDKEMEVLQTEETINVLKDDIEHLKDLVLEKHREALSWEAQYKLIEETLLWRKEQKSTDNDVNLMKTEIHRMQIRHQQLKRAQEKLMQDLEHTVLHRETIFDAASRRSQTDSKLNKSKAPSSVQSQLTDMRTKIKQIDSEINELSNTTLQQLNDEHEHMQSEIAALRQQLESSKLEFEDICRQIDEAVLQKYLNIELIVREQNRVKAYEKLSKSRQPQRITYSDSNLDMHQQKAIEYNEKLQDVVQTLLNEFPERHLFLNKILHLLKL